MPVQPGMATGTAVRAVEVGGEVLERARGGDPAAFRALVGHYDRGLRALAWRLLHDRGRMDDVLQDAYLKAYRGLRGFRGDSGVGSWLYRITYNACLDELRRAPAAGAPGPLVSLEERPAGGAGPAERAVLRTSLEAALAALPPDQRAAVLLVDAEGFDYAAAASVLGIAEGTVASRVHRARSALRAALAEEGGDHR